MTFHAQIWLYAALVTIPVLVGLFWLLEGRREGRLRAFAAAPLLADLAASFSPGKRNLKLILLVIAVGLLMAALARPRWGYVWEETRGRSLDIMVALDTSKSMLAEDIAPNRLARAKLSIRDLVERVEGDRVGIIAFAGSAFLQCPLTLDTNALRVTLDAIGTDTIPLGGTNIAGAIAEAQGAFSDGQNEKFLILITDGEDLAASGIEAARSAAEAGVRVFTVGVGTAEGELIPVRGEDGSFDFLRDPDGNVVKTRLDTETLTEIARASRGFFTPLGPTGEGLIQVYERGLEILPRQEREDRLRQIPIERFQWPLGLAILLLMVEGLIGTRRGRRDRTASAGIPRASAIFLAAAIIAGTGGKPLAASVGKAEALFKEGDFAGAAEQYRAALEDRPDDPRVRYNLGSSLYRTGDFEAAERAFEEALRTDDVALQKDIFYNLGNTRYRAGDELFESGDHEGTIAAWEDAIKQYAFALDLVPGDEDAAYNKAFVEERLEKLKEMLQNQQQSDQSGDQSDQDQENDESSEDSGDSSGSDSSQPEQSDEGSEEGEPQDGQQDSSSQEDQQESGSPDASESPSGDSGEPESESEPQPSPDGGDEGEEDPSQQPQPQPGDEEGQKEEPPASPEAGEEESEGEEASPEETPPQPSGSAGEEGDESEAAPGQQAALPVGAMSREEARQLLEAMRETEKKLPLTIQEGELREEQREGRLKDW